MAIKLLEDNLINKIAAGEVVERPASVVKELVENSIDAGADRISVNITGGGIDCIEVEDNGSGIAPDELILAFQRHATSKISTEEDLNHIATMGFRGEALPSIASVSKIQLFSADSDCGGIQARLEGGVMVSSSPASCPRGTRVIVSDIFYNTPARRNFLKTPVTEGNNVHEIMNRLALSRPDISFKFASQHKNYFKTPGNRNLFDTVIAIYGHDFGQNLIQVGYESERFSITGLVSGPETTRINRKNQLFFINTRAVRSPLLYKAVDQAYRGLLLSREFPIVMLSINMPAAEVDVNVHPQKTEVRFRDEKTVFRLVVEVVRNVLENSHYKLNLSRSNESLNSSGSQSTVYSKNFGNGYFDFKYLPAAESPGAYGCHPDSVSSNRVPSANYEFPDKSDGMKYRVIGQCFDSYILVEAEKELLLIDQHAAHERINYEKLRSSAGQSDSVQALAFPVSLQLSAGDMQVLEANLDTLTQLGFEIDLIGPLEVTVRTTPWAARGREQEIILELIELFQEGKQLDLTDEAYKLMACKKSIKAGQVLSRLEMETIMGELFSLKEYKNCPHGRPVILNISRHEMDRHFKRI